MPKVSEYSPQLLARGLAAFGIGPGSAVAVLAAEPLAAELHLAVGLTGSRSLSVPTHSTGARLWLRLRGVAAAITADDDAAGQIRLVAGELTDLRLLWSVAGGALDELAAAAAGWLPPTADRATADRAILAR